MVKTVFLILILFGAVPLRGELQFVGMMSSSQGEYFAVHEKENQRAEWVTKGGSVGGYIIESYDPKNETLILKRGDSILKLQLPSARVQPLKRDEILAGLGSIMNHPQVQTIGDFIHPMLRHLVKNEDLDTTVFASILKPTTKTEVRELPPEWAQVMDSTLKEVEKAIGVRPTHGLWVKNGPHLSMTLVGQVGNSWYIIPNVFHPTATKEQSPPPTK